MVSVKMLTLKHPDKVIQRLNYLMTEFNFIVDIFDFQKVPNPEKYQAIIQSHIEQMIDIAGSQNLLQLGDDSL